MLKKLLGSEKTDIEGRVRKNGVLMNSNYEEVTKRTCCRANRSASMSLTIMTIMALASWMETM